MRNLVRNAATVVAAVGLAVSVAPAASAATAAAPKAPKERTAPEQVINVYFGTGDAQFANEFGPGNLAPTWLENSAKARVKAQNEAIRTGNIKNSVKGKNNKAPFEIEGSEQDQNEG